MIQRLASFLRNRPSFLRDCHGIAAVEFAMIAPILGLMIVGINDGAQLLFKQNDMHSGVSAAAEYIMRGGSDMATAQSIGLSAWASHSDGASVTASKMCYCAGAAGDCTSLCPDQSVPSAYITVAASDSYTGLFATTTLATDQKVRVR
ncbi:MAG TPA: TadE/TadG family type IV pilus assembly protein [Asticcacaulis sp.]|nr:TadE/TadG family type IV pilus assembly protein [Asticcacaulis sp.]